jgi:hypothetical protein
MVKLKTENPDSFADFVEIIENLQSNKDHSIWYRGCGNHSHQLLPTLYRHRKIKTLAGFSGLENGLITRFRQRSVPFHNRNLTDDWDLLFFMQHYGVPTRLLDWTENPFVAFYFAVMSAPFTVTPKGTVSYSSSSAIWILDPVAWNRHALRHQSFDGTVLAPGDDPIKAYKPNQSYSGMNQFAVAIYGAHNSPRIVAQRGVFTIFGQNLNPMEQTFAKERFPKDSLIKVVLKRQLLKKMRSSILNNGVTESVIFPDLDGLAREMRRLYNFEG